MESYRADDNSARQQRVLWRSSRFSHHGPQQRAPARGQGAEDDRQRAKRAASGCSHGLHSSGSSGSAVLVTTGNGSFAVGLVVAARNRPRPDAQSAAGGARRAVSGRRFLLHVLPDGFQRIRHYGLLGNRARARKLTRCRQLLDAPPPPPPVLATLADPHDRYQLLTGRSLRVCPVCPVGIMQRIAILPATVGYARPVFWADTS